MTQQLEILVLEIRCALARLPAGSPVPDWARGKFAAVISSTAGITVVCDERTLPAGAQARSGFRCLEIAGEFELEFDRSACRRRTADCDGEDQPFRILDVGD